MAGKATHRLGKLMRDYIGEPLIRQIRMQRAQRFSGCTLVLAK